MICDVHVCLCGMLFVYFLYTVQYAVQMLFTVYCTLCAVCWMLYAVCGMLSTIRYTVFCMLYICCMSMSSIRGAAVPGCATPLARAAPCGWLSSRPRAHRDQSSLQPGQARHRTGGNVQQHTRSHPLPSRLEYYSADKCTSQQTWVYIPVDKCNPRKQVCTSQNTSVYIPGGKWVHPKMQVSTSLAISLYIPGDKCVHASRQVYIPADKCTLYQTSVHPSRQMYPNNKVFILAHKSPSQHKIVIPAW